MDDIARIDALERRCNDMTVRIQQLEATNAMRARAEFRKPSPILMADKEHPGRSLGIGSHRPLGEALDEDGA